MLEPVSVLGIDPGQRTGFALFTRDRDGQETWKRWTVAYDPCALEATLIGTLTDADPRVIIAERFTPGGKPHFDATALKVLGIVELIAAWDGGALVYQLPSDIGRNGLVTPALQRELGLWIPGEAHKDENQATRHVLFWLITTNNEPFWLPRPPSVQTVTTDLV